MNWHELRGDSRLKPHQTSPAEINELRDGVEVKLSDARSTAISDDTRFVTA